MQTNSLIYKERPIQYVYKLNQKEMQKISMQERLKNELKMINQSQEDHPEWKVIETSENSWKVQINCSVMYPYHGPPFHLLISFPNNYPYGNATITVVQKSKIYHPNIGPDGSICQVVIKQQDITLMIKDRLDQFMSFLKQPNPNSPLNGDAGTIFAIQLNFTQKIKNNFTEQLSVFIEEFNQKNDHSYITYSEIGSSNLIIY